MKLVRKIWAENDFRAFIGIILIIFIFFSCQKKTSRSISISFYHWKSQVESDTIAFQYLQKLQVRKIYFRLFDVDWSEYEKKALPIGEVDSIPNVLKSYQIIPTIFITNQTMLQIPTSKLADLAEKMVRKIRSKTQQLKISEIQLDCDWSEKSKAHYFKLIQEIKKIIGADKIEISATIRLHQYRYFHQTGVPEIKRGVLMFYNMGDIRAEETQNSILDNQIGATYLKTKQTYPIHLDIALPLFGWGVLKRQGKVIDLLHNAQNVDFQDKTKYRKVVNNHFEVLQSHYAFGKYLYQNDKIRVEQTTYKQLVQSVQLLQKHFHSDSLEVIYYHLDKQTLQKFSVAQLFNLSKELH